MAIKQIVHDAYAIAKDASISNIDVTLDTSMWSKRKQNIIVKAIDLGVADCGWETANFVAALTKTYDIGVQKVTQWNRDLDLDLVEPSRVEEVKAYVAALIRTRVGVTSWSENRFMNALENGHVVSRVPIPVNFGKGDRQKFVADYLKPQDEADRIRRDNLINKIRSGHKLTISFTI